MEVKRCPWASGTGAALVAYHDTEWGVPSHDDRRHFEFLLLEGAQAGLSWTTILHKRAGYARAFAAFDATRVARYSSSVIRKLAADPSIVRNRRKIESAVANARAFLQVEKEFGSFDAYVWRFVRGKPRQNRWKTLAEVPPSSEESKAMSKDLLGRGFNFVGPTIVYAYMQAIGMVNDHLTECFRYRVIRSLASV